MREIFVHQDATRVGYYKSILDEAGIPNLIRNENTHNTMAEMPAAIFFPTLCVLNEEDYDRALELLEQVHQPPPATEPDWTCGRCGEEVPGNFDSCWKCEGPRPAM